MKTNINLETVIATTTSTTETKVEVKAFHCTVTGFKYTEGGQLKVFFTCGEKSYSAFAHPALKVSPLMGEETIIKVACLKPDWKVCFPRPSEDDIAEYEAKKVASAKVYADEQELAYLAGF